MTASYTALNRPSNFESTVLQRFIDLDWIGTFLCLGMTVSLLLPLQWGGNIKAWKDPIVIALFCVFVAVLGIFLLWQWYKGKAALLPLFLLKRRTQIGCCLESFWLLLMTLIGTFVVKFKFSPVHFDKNRHVCSCGSFRCLLSSSVLSG